MEIDARAIINGQRALEAGLEKNITLEAQEISVPMRDGTVNQAYFFSAGKEGRVPTLFEIHGGSFAWGSPVIDHCICERFRDDLGINVVALSYRLAPEYVYPTQAEDCYDAIRFFFRHADEYGIDTERCSVGGFSAGGNLAAVMCLMAKDRGEFRFVSQILGNPWLDVATSPFDKPAMPEGTEMENWRDQLLAYAKIYATEEQRTNKYVSPVCAGQEDVKDLPPALLLIAEVDLLGAESLAYEEILKRAGVPVTSHTVKGASHGFVDFGLHPEYCLAECMPEGDFSEEQKSGVVAYFRNFAEEGVSVMESHLRSTMLK